MNRKEIWKPIKNYEELYSISNFGNVFSLKTKKHKKQQLNEKGYLCLCLYNNGKRKRFKVHRLVAQTFIPNPENKAQVNHKNGIKTDNTIDNLEWCTNSENMKHAIENNLIMTNKRVAMFDLEDNLIAEFKSISEASRKTNISNISNVCNGVRKQSKNYKFKFI